MSDVADAEEALETLDDMMPLSERENKVARVMLGFAGECLCEILHNCVKAKPGTNHYDYFSEKAKRAWLALQDKDYLENT